jgi:hypothetical protein
MEPTEDKPAANSLDPDRPLLLLVDDESIT